jgi:phenylalanyl-tRNA synthetase beta chain
MKELEMPELVKTIISLGIHLEGEDESVLRLEYDPNRPDFSSDYGIARAVKGKLGIELGSPRHKLRPTKIQVIVDTSVQNIRPYIACVVARGLSLDDESIRQIISMQEDLHAGLGRKRKKFAIGLHNLDVLVPPIYYTVAESDFAFIPLGFSSPMTIEHLLKATEVGRKYGGLVKGHQYPILKDSNDTVLSIPPIINGTATEVKSGVGNLFVDVTGTERRLVEDALAIISEALADAGGDLEKVSVKQNDETMTTPNLNPRKVKLKIEEVKNLLGINLSASKIVDSLRKVRFDASQKKQSITVEIPRYRVDILHAVDLIEEVAYGYGFENLTPDFSFRYSKGREDELAKGLRSVRRLLVGLGFQEITNYSLSSRDLLYKNLLREDKNALKVESSKTQLYEFLRDTLVAGMLDVMSKNIHQEYPQKLFEIGYCFQKDDSSETGVREELLLCCAIAAERAAFSDIRSVLDTFLLRLKNIRPKYIAHTNSYIAEGRCAASMVGEIMIGYVGEIKPEVLVNFGIRMPVSIFEIKIESLLLDGK